MRLLAPPYVTDCWWPRTAVAKPNLQGCQHRRRRQRFSRCWRRPTSWTLLAASTANRLPAVGASGHSSQFVAAGALNLSVSHESRDRCLRNIEGSGDIGLCISIGKALLCFVPLMGCQDRRPTEFHTLSFCAGPAIACTSKN